MAVSLDPKRTALLVMDCQRMLVDGYPANPDGFLALGAEVIVKARSAGIKIIYVTIGFRRGFPEVSNDNMIFTGIRAAELFVRGRPGFEIPGEIAPSEEDVVIEKHRVCCFEGTDLEMILRAGRIDTLAMFGIATSGCVLSTVRRAADLDYRLVVLRDLCVDKDADVQHVLLDKVLPSQAAVVTAEEFLSRL